jgi:hypothetical protein
MNRLASIRFRCNCKVPLIAVSFERIRHISSKE